MEGTMSINRPRAIDIDELLHPARAFSHPMDVVRDTDLTLYEKRAILSSWASDACAVEDFPEFRQPSGAAPVKFDDIMDALRGLDAELERRVGANTNTVGRRRSGPEESEDISLL
jgi:hypothetical protein